MANLITYAKEYGKYTLQERPFNEVDNLIFSYLVYYDLRDIVPPPKSAREVLLADAGAAYLKLHGNTQTNVSAALFRELIRAPRFQSVRLSDFVDVTKTGRTQFSALRAVLPDETAVLTVRGVDNTLTAWQESFAISCGRTPSQRMAVQWMNRLAARDAAPTPIILTGHSKGGNTLLYAATACKPALRARIRAIYLNDSPGLTPGLYDEAVLQTLESRIVRYAPAYSLVGRLFETAEPDCIVACSVKGLYQHEPLYWQIEDNHFVRAPAPDPRSRTIARALNRWVASATIPEREAFIADLFRTLRQKRADGLRTVPEEPPVKQTVSPSAGQSGSDADPLSDTLRLRDLAKLLLNFLLTASRDGRRTARKLLNALIKQSLTH